MRSRSARSAAFSAIRATLVEAHQTAEAALATAQAQGKALGDHKAHLEEHWPE